MPPTEPDFSARGPYAVGVLQTTVLADDVVSESARPLPAEVWYPAAAGADARDDAPHPLGLTHRATPGLPPHPSARPLVAFSHGNSGFRLQSTFLTTHLASWGIVVVAPDHVGNTFPEMATLADDEARRSMHRRIRALRPRDLHASLRALLEPDVEGARALPRVDAGRVGVLGHSFGGWTALKLPALEPRVRVVCGLAPVAEPFVGRKAFAPGELPLSRDTRTLVLAARDDVLVDLDTSIRPLAARLGPCARVEIIDRADHFHFCDGVELLHRMHENNPRPGQLRSTRPFAELRPEDEMHAILKERVMRFFAEGLGSEWGQD